MKILIGLAANRGNIVAEMNLENKTFWVDRRVKNEKD
jgi:hypothetical protein